VTHAGPGQRVTPLQREALRSLLEHGPAKLNQRGRYAICNDHGECVLWVTQRTVDGLALRELVTYKGVDGDVELTATGRLEAVRPTSVGALAPPTPPARATRIRVGTASLCSAPNRLHSARSGILESRAPYRVFHRRRPHTHSLERRERVKMLKIAARHATPPRCCGSDGPNDPRTPTPCAVSSA